MKRIYGTLLLLGVLTAALAAPAAGAENEAVMMDPVTVTARGYAASQSDTPGSVGVVTEKEITLAPKGSIADSLTRIPGLTRTGDSPWGQDISIRGLAGPSVIILLDGKRINTATDMNARLGFINPEDVERVEVLKGPVSALYGSGSIGGVVNIITRKGKFSKDFEAHGRLAASGSTNPGGGDAYANISLSGERGWGFASGAFRNYGDTFGGENSWVPNSQFKDKQGRGMFGVKPWDPLTIEVQVMQSTGDNIGLPGGVSSMPALAKVTYPSSEFTFASIDAALQVDASVLKTIDANFYYTRNKRRVRVDDIPPQSSPQYPNAYPLELKPSADHETYGGKLQGTFEAGGHTIVAGADFWTWSVSSERTRSMWRRAPAGGPITFTDHPTPDADQYSIGLFAEDNWKLSSDWTLNLGGRLDYLRTKADPMYLVSPAPGPGNTTKTQLYDDTNEKDLGWHLHAGLTWKMNSAWSQSALIASSYRAADLMERFKYIDLGGGRVLYGNPELDPEQSIYGEYGLHYDKKPFRADLRLFANIVTNYIAEKQVSANRYELDNVDDARIYGAELETRWQFHDNWGLYGNVAALYGKDKENDQALPGIAPISGLLGVDFKYKGFWARLEGKGIAPQRSTPEGVEKTDGVITMNAALGYDFTTAMFKHSVSLTLDNIFDARYYNYLAHQRGYTVWEPGFSASLNYSIEF